MPFVAVCSSNQQSIPSLVGVLEWNAEECHFYHMAIPTIWMHRVNHKPNDIVPRAMKSFIIGIPKLMDVPGERLSVISFS